MANEAFFGEPVVKNSWCRSAGLLVVALWAASAGCGYVKGEPFRYDPGVPLQVTQVAAEPGDQAVTLRWQPVAAASSYVIYYVSDLAASEVTKTNSTRLEVQRSLIHTVKGLDNNVTYHFMVAASNRDGEGEPSVQASARPGPCSDTDLLATWYFHTLVTGPDARWERGTVTIASVSADAPPVATIADYEVSNAAGGSDRPSPPAPFALHVDGECALTQPGAGAWDGFRGSMGPSRKVMMVATYSVGAASHGLTILQKQKPDVAYGIADIMGTGSQQNPNNPSLGGNGPTRFAYHQLSSGSETGWEYAVGKVGQHGQYWYDAQGNNAPSDATKDVIYWDYGAPDYKLALLYDFSWKVSSFDVDATGLVTEYDNYYPHQAWFTGRMTADKTVVVGVGTRNGAWPMGTGGASTQYFLRIMELCFLPLDQTLPKYELSDLAGTYRFHELGSSAWAYGSMRVGGDGVTTFPAYANSASASASADQFTLAKRADTSIKGYTDLANFTSPAQDGASRYFDASGNPYHTYYDFWTSGRRSNPMPLGINDATGRSYYYNEHGSLSYATDLFVLTRTDATGHALLVGLK